MNQSRGTNSLNGTVSVGKAIALGLLWVNGPVFTLLIAPLFLLGLGNRYGFLPRAQNWLAVPLFAGGFALAWLWWSITVPKWRLWAYERVTDIAKLKEQAVAVGITWRSGSIFNKTELKSRAHALREQELDQLRTDPTHSDASDKPF
jgi:hypothetical protein